MNEKAERINGWAAMMGIVAAMGAYAVTKLFLVYGDGYVSHSSNVNRRIRLLGSILD